MSKSSCKNLMDLPPEVLQNILLCCTTPSFLQATLSCRKLFELACRSREVVLEHLENVPGIKLGLEDLSVATKDLFRILRQRASAHLFGVNFTADCKDYRFPNGRLDPSASCLASSADYINISLVLKESNVLRLYSGRCHCKEHIDSPYADGDGRIIQVVHRKHTISVLYEWIPEDCNRFETCPIIELPAFKRSTKQLLIDSDSCEGGSSSTRKRPIRSPEPNPVASTKYHLFHYSAYNTDRPVCFSIPTPLNTGKPLVPVHLAISNRLQCAIIWDVAKAKIRPTAHTRVFMYTCGRLPEHAEGSYVAVQVYPTPEPPMEPNDDEGSRFRPLVGPKPRAAEFYKDGRRLKLYDSGSVVPHAVVYTSNIYIDSPGSPFLVNGFLLRGTMFKIDTAFYCAHETIYEQDRVDCAITHLCLGIERLDGTNKSRSLCIIQNRRKVDYDDCRHTVELDCMPHVPAYSRVVAKLWGWRECSSTLTGLETVCISKKGTRIAISRWNRVFVWSLDPGLFCEEMSAEDNDSEDETRKTGIEATRFYDLEFDEELQSSLVVLTPIVLELGDSVARKMMWTSKDNEETEREIIEETDTSESDSSVSDNRSDSDCVEEEREAEEHGNQDQGQGQGQSGLIMQATVQENAVSTEHDHTNLQRDGNESCNKDKAPLKPDRGTDAHVQISTSTIIDPKAEEDLDTLLDHLRDAFPPSLPTPPPLPDPIEFHRRLPSPSSSRPPPSPMRTPSPLPILNLMTAPDPPAAPSTNDSKTPPPIVLTSISKASKAKLKSSAGPNNADGERGGASQRRPQRKRKRKLRKTEDELVILTDRGVQRWDLGAWGRGRSVVEYLNERLS